jgi:hypothetical protein
VDIIVNTDNNITGNENLIRDVEAVVEKRLGRFATQLTRIEVHLGDVNSHKPGDADKRCMMEARPAGMNALAVTHFAGTVPDAVEQAAKKLERMLDGTFGKLHDAKTRPHPR